MKCALPSVQHLQEKYLLGCVWRTAQSYDVSDLQRSHREHNELLAAFARKDGGWAESVMAGHIRRAFHTYADAHLGKKAPAATS